MSEKSKNAPEPDTSRLRLDNRLKPLAVFTGSVGNFTEVVGPSSVKSRIVELRSADSAYNGEGEYLVTAEADPPSSLPDPENEGQEIRAPSDGIVPYAGILLKVGSKERVFARFLAGESCIVMARVYRTSEYVEAMS